MTDVREVLRRWSAGQGMRVIAQGSGVDRKTVRRYVEAGVECGVARGAEINDDVIARVVGRVQTRKAPPPSSQWTALVAQRARIEAWLAKPLRLVRVHELLVREGVDVGYTTLRRFAREELGWREPKVTIRLDDRPPGDEAQIDFGHVGWVTLPDEKRRRLWAMIVTLSFSRYMFVWPTLTQTVADVCAALDAAWRFFKGIPKHVVLDNASSMIVRADPISPALHRAFGEYVQARGFFADPARVRHPQDKGRVENQVAYVRERCFDGESFNDDLAAIREHAAHWCRNVAGTRTHGTTRQVPFDVFTREEQPKLAPAPTTPFDVPICGKAKVHRDHFAQVARSLYSLPTMHIGKVLDYRADTRIVRFYEAAKLVKTHARVAPGKRAVDVDDFPADKAAYAFRNVDALKSAAYGKAPNVGAFVDRLLGGSLPWMQMRQVHALLRLCDRYGAARVDAMCARAIAFDVLDVRRIEGMLKRAQQVEDEAHGAGKLIALPGRFARDPASFATTPATTTSKRNEGGAR